MAQRKHLGAVYLMHAINGLAWSLIGIFVPIYLLSLGYAPQAVFFYYFMVVGAAAVSSYAAGRSAETFGVRMTVILGFPFLFFYLGLLFNLPHQSVPLVLVAIAQACTMAFYWIPLHMFFTTHSPEQDLGANVSKLFGLPQLATIATPLIGSFVILYGGFPSLLMLSGAVFVISAIPLFWIPELDPPVRVRLRDILQLTRAHPHYIFIEFFENMREEAENIIWPVFVYLTFGSILSIGIVGALVSLGSVLLMFSIGKRIDTAETKTYMRLGACIMAAVWIARVFVHDQIAFYALTLAAGFFGGLIVIPWNTYIYRIAKKKNPPAFIVFREFVLAVTRLCSYALAVFFAFHLRDLFPFIAAACVLLLLL